jgi:hypothetical protein
MTEATEQDLEWLLTIAQEEISVVAWIVGRLRGDGWLARIEGDRFICEHPRVGTERAAERRLERLSISLNDVEVW